MRLHEIEHRGGRAAKNRARAKRDIGPEIVLIR